MEDVGEHKNLGAGVVGTLKKRQSTKAVNNPEVRKITKKELKEGAVNGGVTTAKAEYLRHRTKTVGIMNAKGEYEIKLTKDCGQGDVVWVMEDDGTFTKTKIY